MSLVIEDSQVEARDHVVQFYEVDEDLVRSVGRFLATGLLAGDRAVVVATPSHREAFEVAIAAMGVDVEAARSDGSYSSLDAAETLDTFMVGGSPDAARFEASIGGLIASATANGRSVRVFGEMVALLWDEGNVNAAIDLEALWNDLARRQSFSLFCAYPTRAFGTAEERARFDDVCGQHSKVVSVDESRKFNDSLRSPRAARRFVAEVLTGWHWAELVDDAVLVVSELASNAVLHAKSAFAVTVSRQGDFVTISVKDLSSAPPLPRTIGPESANGRGMRIIAAMAVRWGTDMLSDGKAVWAELDRRRPYRADVSAK